MNASPSAPGQPSNRLRAILWGGLTASTVDFIFASTYYAWLRGKSAVRIWQSVAGGLLGKESFNGGLATAALGGFLHYLIGLIWAAIYVALSTRFRVLIQQPLLCGLVYGAVIYVGMNMVVLPLSALHLPAYPLSMAFWPVAIHLVGIGPAIAFSARRFLK